MNRIDWIGLIIADVLTLLIGGGLCWVAYEIRQLRNTYKSHSDRVTFPEHAYPEDTHV